MIRNIIAVIAAYAIFVVTSVAFFKITKQDPHLEASTAFMIATAIYGAVFSFLSGLVLQLIAKTNNLKLNLILAAIIAGFAAFSFFKASGSHWTQLLAMIFFAPISIAGGFLYVKRKT